ncbi:MAG: ABC transporter permease [Actinobacteria bacterium]|nr:MAG: ABC transporter permease [Actinomycetota bacterium]
MALSLDYVARETWTNLRRNFLMTSAAILTVAVSLSLVGGALLLRQGVSRATVQWRGGVELSIFMQPDATPPQTDAVERQLSQMPEVKKVTYVGQDAAYDEFKRMFANEPDMVESVTAKDLPPSYRVVPKRAEFVDAIGEHFKNSEGVRKVVFARETVQTLLKVTRILQILIFGVAAVLFVSALVLILNTIRMAIFARRREVAIMKLVGATNWFIRVPFMLEGMIQGVAGAAVAFVVVFLGRNLVAQAVNSYDLQLIRQLVVSSQEAIGTGIVILFAGAVIGTVSSAIAVGRFLDV